MKNKKTICGTILLLFVISGLCGVVNVSADSWNDVEISPLSYVYVSTDTLEYKDELMLSVSSSGTINIYIMDASQFSTLQSSGGLIWEYCVRWKDTTYLEYTYLVQEDGVYYVVLYNKNILFGRTVDFSITIDYYYEPFDPFDPDDNPTETFLWNLLIFVVVPIVAIVLVITIPIVIIRKHKKRTPKEDAIIRETPKSFYCSNCDAEITDITIEYCSKCGNKIIRQQNY